MDKFKEKLSKALHDVEHALSIYANSFCTFPAKFIYDKELLKQYEKIISTCHIYMIGYLPSRKLVEMKQIGRNILMEFKLEGKKRTIKLSLPEGANLAGDYDEGYYAENDKGQKFSIPEEAINHSLSKYSKFDVRYIGQAYGKDGSRNALDRLLKHETLQKISLTGTPKECELSLLLLEVESSNRMITALNPFASKKDDDGSRVKAGLNKLYNTTEQERISLFEASFIRYFSPQFNKEFKNSFPSTNLKVLQDCYDKDFSAVFAEINIDELPFQLGSESVDVNHYHFAKHDLHKEKDRKAFFTEA